MIDAWRDFALEAPEPFMAWGGLLVGLAFGFIVARTNFCTMGSLSDILSFGDWNRFRAWMLAIAVAILGVWWLERAGMADMSTSMYQTPLLGWGGNIVGGLLFGFGMVFAGGCLSRNLVRAGGGDLRSVTVLLVTGVFAFMTIGGLLGPLRVALFSPLTADLQAAGMADQSLGELVAGLTGMAESTATTVLAICLAALFAVFAFSAAAFRSSGRDIAAGIGIGLCVVAGWMVTGLAFDEFADNPSVISLTYVRPVGDAMDYLMRYTAIGVPGFGVASVGGALLGGFLGAVSMRRFHLTTFADTADTLRNMFGAAIMGIGGVLALGCTVGQGLTGVSTLAVGSFITLACIILGGIAGIKTMERIA